MIMQQTAFNAQQTNNTSLTYTGNYIKNVYMLALLQLLFGIAHGF